MEQEYQEIGKIRKPHGLNGEMRVQIVDRYWEDLLHLGMLFLDINGQKVPFFIASIRPEAVPPIIALEDVDTKEAAERYKARPIFLRVSDLSSPIVAEAPEQDLYYGYLQGFELLDQDKLPVGRILRIDVYPQQEMAVLEREGKEVLVPLHDALILSLDEEQQIVQMDLPEGLLNL